jgi:aminopeptidase-like protein
LTDSAASYVVSKIDPEGKVIPFSPYGYDERQLCSPGFNLPVGRLTRSVNDGYAQYHSSADDLTLIRPESLEQSLNACKLFVDVLENDYRYVNLSPKGEPRLGKRGLYGTVGGTTPAEREHAMLWILNQSDGSQSLLDVARRSDLPFNTLRGAATALEEVGLLQRIDNARVARAGALRSSPPTATRKSGTGARRASRRRSGMRKDRGR